MTPYRRRTALAVKAANLILRVAASKEYVEALERLINDARTLRRLEREPKEMSPEQASSLEEILAIYYCEPVRPVSHYCNAFRTWQQAILEADKRGDYDEDHSMKMVAERLRNFELDIAIHKSNLLGRLIYGGQSLRTEKCPTHKGRWSGWGWGKECECQDGPDITGWLPND